MLAFISGTIVFLIYLSLSLSERELQRDETHVQIILMNFFYFMTKQGKKCSEKEQWTMQNKSQQRTVTR